MKPAADAGHTVNLIFVGIQNLALCRAGIGERTESGGHAVPPKDVARRSGRSLANWPLACLRAERVFVLDNTGEKRQLLRCIERDRVKHLSGNLPQSAKEAIPPRFIRSRSHDLGR